MCCDISAVYIFGPKEQRKVFFNWSVDWAKSPFVRTNKQEFKNAKIQSQISLKLNWFLRRVNAPKEKFLKYFRGKRIFSDFSALFSNVFILNESKNYRASNSPTPWRPPNFIWEEEHWCCFCCWCRCCCCCCQINLKTWKWLNSCWCCCRASNQLVWTHFVFAYIATSTIKVWLLLLLLLQLPKLF